MARPCNILDYVAQIKVKTFVFDKIDDLDFTQRIMLRMIDYVYHDTFLLIHNPTLPPLLKF